MLVVVALCAGLVVFISTRLNWISERERAITWMEQSDAHWAALGAGLTPKLNSSAPLSIRLLGASGVESVTVIAYSERTIRARMDQLSKLFPEAKINVFQLGESPDAKIDPPWNQTLSTTEK
jgi:hypothetical protein